VIVRILENEDMGKSRRRYSRTTGIKRYRKLFVLSLEGSKTEPAYFETLNRLTETSVVHIRCLKKKTASSPKDVLKAMKKHIQDEGLSDRDEAWLVIDRDSWPDTQIKELFTWSQTAENYNLAVSNPKFEIWLLYHFESPRNTPRANSVEKKLCKHIPDYKKSFDSKHISREGIACAIKEAKRRDKPLYYSPKTGQ
jgi:hypothetical protein